MFKTQSVTFYPHTSHETTGFGNQSIYSSGFYVDNCLVALTNSALSTDTLSPNVTRNKYNIYLPKKATNMSQYMDALVSFTYNNAFVYGKVIGVQSWTEDNIPGEWNFALEVISVDRK